MGIMGELNYRYNNPDAEETQQLTPDKDCVFAFLSKEREKNVIEAFASWASMSKENTNGQLDALMDTKAKEQGFTK